MKSEIIFREDFLRNISNSDEFKWYGANEENEEDSIYRFVILLLRVSLLNLPLRLERRRIENRCSTYRSSALLPLEHYFSESSTCLLCIPEKWNDLYPSRGKKGKFFFLFFLKNTYSVIIFTYDSTDNTENLQIARVCDNVCVYN